MRTTLAILSIGLFFPISALSDDLTGSETAVWELEEAYYEFAKANDPESYLALFDENVIGWPALDDAPKGKSQVSQWISSVHAEPSEIWNYELSRLAIQSFGDVVVVHYRLRDFFVSADTGYEIRSDTSRISHTWQWRDGTWRIISGMGAALN